MAVPLLTTHMHSGLPPSGLPLLPTLVNMSDLLYVWTPVGAKSPSPSFILSLLLLLRIVSYSTVEFELVFLDFLHSFFFLFPFSFPVILF